MAGSPCSQWISPRSGFTYIGTWGHTERVRHLAAVHEPDSGRRIYGGKNQISNLAFIYTCAEILTLNFLKFKDIINSESFRKV